MAVSEGVEVDTGVAVVVDARGRRVLAVASEFAVLVTTCLGTFPTAFRALGAAAAAFFAGVAFFVGALFFGAAFFANGISAFASGAAQSSSPHGGLSGRKAVARNSSLSRRFNITAAQRCRTTRDFCWLPVAAEIQHGSRATGHGARASCMGSNDGT